MTPSSPKTVRPPRANTLRARIMDMVKAGKTPEEIEQATGKKHTHVMSEIRVLRYAGLLPATARPSTDGERKIFVGGILSAPVEEVRVVSCPKCKSRFQILG